MWDTLAPQMCLNEKHLSGNMWNSEEVKEAEIKE